MKKKKKNSCLFSDFRLIFAFIFLFHFIFFCSSWYLIEIKIYTNQLDQVCLIFLLTLLFLLDFLMLHINILLFFHSRHIFESIIFNIEDNVWFRFGGDVHRFIFFCFVLLCLKKKKKKKKNKKERKKERKNIYIYIYIFCLAWGLWFEFVILLLLKEFHCFHA